MSKRLQIHIALASLLCISLLLTLLGCRNSGISSDTSDKTAINETDYAGTLQFDTSSDTLKQSVTVKTYVDGDTVHFNVPDSVAASGLLKARFLAVNTPESTGKVEEWGKKASEFTKGKLSEASSIYIESDNTDWNLDSTGGRYLVWVWYRSEESGLYRNLNIELLQNGLAIASSSANNRYGNTCTAAIDQAKALKLNIYSGKKDPDFYYGEATELTLRELRLNVGRYQNQKVAFEGVITINSSNTVYVEDYDPESDMYFGMSVYYGYGLSGTGLDILSIGNRARIVGTVQYYEAGGTWQISGLTYRQMKPDDPGNIQKISEGHSASYKPITPDQLCGEKVTIMNGETEFTELYAALAMSTSVSMSGLTVKSVYTTDNPESSQYGALSLTCEAEGKTITVRTAVLYNNGNLVKAREFEGKTIDVKGIIDFYDGNYQIKVLNYADITVN